MPNPIILDEVFPPLFYISEITIDDVSDGEKTQDFEFDRPAVAYGSPNLMAFPPTTVPQSVPVQADAPSYNTDSIGKTTGTVTVRPLTPGPSVDVKIKLLVIYPADPTILARLFHLLGIGGGNTGNGNGGAAAKGKGARKGGANLKAKPKTKPKTKAKATKTPTSPAKGATKTQPARKSAPAKTPPPAPKKAAKPSKPKAR